MAWLDAEEANSAAETETASDWITENKVRAALEQRLAT